MISKSIIKLLDEALIPAVVLIIAKMFGIFASAYFLGINFTVKNADILWILPSVQFNSLNDFTKADNLSNLAMFAAAATGTFLVLIRAHFFHQTHIKPSLHAKLASLNLESLIAPSYHLYHQAVIWLIYLWLTTGFLLISALILKVTYPQIAATAFIITANFTWVFALDVEKEMELEKSQ